MTTQDYVDAINLIAVDMKLEVSGVMESVTELRSQLTVLETLLNDQAYGRASLLGYHDISLAFVELQRCLGGVQALYTDEHLLLQDVARERQCSVEAARHFLESQRQLLKQDDQQQGKHNE